MAMIKKNDLIELKINSITNLGFGVSRHEVKIKEEDAKKAFIKAGLPEAKIASLVPSCRLRQSSYRIRRLTLSKENSIYFLQPNDTCT